MESGAMEYDSPIGQAKKWKMVWKQFLVMINGFQVLQYLQKRIVPTRDKRKTSLQYQYSNGQTSEPFYPKL
jgi:hypothetical protein